MSKKQCLKSRIRRHSLGPFHVESRKPVIADSNDTNILSHSIITCVHNDNAEHIMKGLNYAL